MGFIAIYSSNEAAAKEVTEQDFAAGPAESCAFAQVKRGIGVVRPDAQRGDRSYCVHVGPCLLVRFVISRSCVSCEARGNMARSIRPPSRGDPWLGPSRSPTRRAGSPRQPPPSR